MVSQSKNQHNAWTPRLAKLQGVLMCPTCRGSLNYHPSQAMCTPCGKAYKVENGKLYFIDCATETDELDKIKGALKRLLGANYPILTGILGPTLLPNYTKLVDSYFSDGKELILDVGCGNRRVRDDIIGIDVMDHAAVDVVCDMHQLPFHDGLVRRFDCNPAPRLNQHELGAASSARMPT